METSNSHPDIEQRLTFIPPQALSRGRLGTLGETVEIFTMSQANIDRA